MIGLDRRGYIATPKCVRVNMLSAEKLCKTERWGVFIGQYSLRMLTRVLIDDKDIGVRYYAWLSAVPSPFFFVEPVFRSLS
jgi:hypothetical protein